jgi:hypothetical protein
MFSRYAKLRFISILLLYGWLIAAYSGNVVLCVETQGETEFEAGWINECCVPGESGAAGCSTLTCDNCKHYPLQLCAVHCGRDCKIAFAENQFHITQFHSDKNGHANIVYQPFLSIPTDTLRTVVLII